MRFSAAGIILLLHAAGCFYVPALDQHGYTACEQDSDCNVGRSCLAATCVPPPWHDDTYGPRRLLVLENETPATLPSGSAVVFWVGESGMTLALDEVPSDSRYSYYDAEQDRWQILPVFMDTFDDRYGVWVPLQQPLAAGGRGALVWMESNSGEADEGPYINPADVFQSYFNFGEREPCETPWLCFGTGAPVLDGSAIRIADNQMMVLSDPLSLPFDLSFKLQVNGTSCQSVFWGVKGTKNQSFEPPMFGFNVGSDRSMAFELYPQPDSLSPQLTDLTTMDTKLRTYRIHAGPDAVRIYRDQDLLAVETVDPPLDASVDYFPYLDVDGDCSIDLRGLWRTNTPVGSVKITPESPVNFQLFD